MKKFSDFYESLTIPERAILRDVLDVRLGWGRSTFYYKLRWEHFSRVESREVAAIMGDFQMDMEKYIREVKDFLSSGQTLFRQSTPRKGKQINKKLDKLYETQQTLQD